MTTDSPSIVTSTVLKNDLIKKKITDPSKRSRTEEGSSKLTRLLHKSRQNKEPNLNEATQKTQAEITPNTR
ncbi:MAG: hypothetical protein LBM38_03615 [Clostridiales bacterium]|jgi:hypothetical protein|nr:hypothetical protein [Clostridiales bacterium]